MPELQIDRIVDIVVEELVRGGIGSPPRSSAGPPEHGDADAIERIASVIDHTLLKPEASRSEIERLCREGLELAFATVCVNPVWTAACAALLRSDALLAGLTEPRRRAIRTGSGIPGICCVVGFPLGATSPDVKQYEARRAIGDGATEIDMVLNIGALKSGDLLLAARDVLSVTSSCREAGVLSKVIVETALLTDEEKVAACVIARGAGADFVKTSTGFAPGGAVAADVRLMRRVVGNRMGIKASGGIRDLAAATIMLQAGATRIGTSAGVAIVREAEGAGPPRPPGSR